MPLYEYKCKSCGKVFEILQKFSDAPLETHENCGGAVERLLSPPALQFKGTGWYITDYARSSGAGKQSHSGENGKSDSSPGKKSEGSATTTPPPAKESKPSQTGK